jgi:hypothetical protein
MPALAPKANDVLTFIESQFKFRRPNDLALRKIYNEATPLIQRSDRPWDGYMILSLADALAYKPDSVVNNFNCAIRLSSEPHLRLNGITCLHRIGLMESAFQHAWELADKYRDDLAILRVAVASAVDSGRFHAFMELAERFKKLAPQAEFNAWETYMTSSLVASVVQHMDKLGITDDDLSRRVDAALSVLREAKEPLYNSVFDVSPNGSISLKFQVFTDIDTAIDYSFAMANKVISSFDDPLSDILTTGCLPYDELYSSRPSELRGEAL